MGNDDKRLLGLLEASVARMRPDGVLLSGGIDSSALAYVGARTNPEIVAVTVATSGADSPDTAYAKLVAKELGLQRHVIAEIAPDEFDGLVRKVVIGLQNFSVHWVTAATVLYKGLERAKQEGLASVLTGEGSDDLFGTFPVMQNWKHSPEELVGFIATRMQDIDVMTGRMAAAIGIGIALPFHDPTVVDFALNLPLSVRTRITNDGKRITKYPLREAFEGRLPPSVVSRPQTMAFVGASTLETCMHRYVGCDVEAYRKAFGIDFGNPFECFLFDIYQNAGLYHPVTEGAACIHCHSRLRSENSVHCTSCGSLQYKGELLPF